MNRPVNLFWSESSHFFGANSPVRNFERNVPEESSREELVLERTVPEPITDIRLVSLLEAYTDTRKKAISGVRDHLFLQTVHRNIDSL